MLCNGMNRMAEVRAVGSVVVEPIADGSRSRVTVEFDLNGHGLGILVAPLARMQARKLIPEDHARLKDILERRDSGAAR